MLERFFTAIAVCCRTQTTTTSGQSTPVAPSLLQENHGPSRLSTFFRGAVDELRGAYVKSEGAPSACKGSLRENGIRRAVAYSLPPVARMYQGEIIDPRGGHSGQLDGIVVHGTSGAVATAEEDGRIATAEGVISVLESKSDISGQWDEVLRTWDQVRQLRRYDEKTHGTVTIGNALHDSDRGVPLIVMGRRGWKKGRRSPRRRSDPPSDPLTRPGDFPCVSLVRPTAKNFETMPYA